MQLILRVAVVSDALMNTTQALTAIPVPALDWERGPLARTLPCKDETSDRLTNKPLGRLENPFLWLTPSLLKRWR